MKIEQIYTGCLAEAAYYIESNGEVAIIDPLRETTPYLERANKDGAEIKYIFESHFHADFVSGHVDLAKKTGAKIIYGPSAETAYDSHIAEDNEEFILGDIKIKVLHTPGHTLESSTFLLIDEKGEDHAIFTGDTLFLGDVGRPDLAIKSDLTREDLAGMLFDSLRNKIMPLADNVIVYPAHGAGSACGKNMSKETVGILGDQKENNYALRADMSKEEFVEEVLDGILPPPQYFAKNAMMNKSGYEEFSTVLEKGNVALDPEEFKALATAEGALILDVRNEDDFVKGHIPNSIFIGIDGGFAPWVGSLISDIKHPILLVSPQGREEEVVTRLSRVGYDNTLGYLQGGMDAWVNNGNDVATMESISAQELEVKSESEISIIDVRKPNEYNSEHIVGAKNHPLDYLNDNMGEFNSDEHNYIHCLGGYRSVIAGSILKSRGIHNFTNVLGGYNEIKNTKINLTEFACPTTL